MGNRNLRGRQSHQPSFLLISLAVLGSLLLVSFLDACTETPNEPTEPVPAAEVIVAGATFSLTVGETTQLTATVRDAAGNVLTDRVVSWSSTDGAVASVDGDGMVRGQAEGTATITAASEGKSGSAGITVTGQTGGQVIIFEDGFESGDLSRWDEFDPTKYSVTSDAVRVRSGSYALQAKMFPSDDWGQLDKWYMPGYDEVYVEFDVMFEEGFENLRGDNNGMHFVAQMGNRIDDRYSASGKAGIRPDGTDFFLTVLDPEYVYGDPTLLPFSFYSYFPDMQCYGGPCWGNLFTQDPPKMDLDPGQWYRVVFHVKANTPGVLDGGQTLWIDGQKKIEMNNMRWRDTYDVRLNQFSVWTYMPGAPKTQYIWIDNVKIWRPE